MGSRLIHLFHTRWAPKYDVFARNDILHSLGIPDGKRDEADETLPVLEQLTCLLRRELAEKPPMVDRMLQTVGPATPSLDEKLRQIELERPRESNYRGLEEKMVHFQQECERRCRQDLEAELRHWNVFANLWNLRK